MLDAVERMRRYLEGVDFECRRSIPQIPWSKVISTRNRLIHGYLSVDLEIVWHTATHHVPPLKSDLEEIIGGLKN
jgi:uncharacterized protein with HEPN domain